PGRTPYRAATAVETLRQVIEEEPVAPSRLVPGLPRDLETVCLKCLEKDPARRYPAAAELADELGRFGRGEAVRARPISTAARGWRWCRRNPAVASLLLIVGFLLVLGGTTAGLLYLRAE